MKRNTIVWLITISFVFTILSSIGISIKLNGISFRLIQIYIIIILFVLLFVCLGIILFDYREIKRKNRIIAQLLLKVGESGNGKTEKVIVKEFDKLENNKVERNCVLYKKKSESQELTNEELFQHFDVLVRKNKHYLNYKLGRDDYSRIMGVDKNRFGNIIKEYGGGNISAYLNNLRLQYSVELLNTNPDMSVSEIANRSAFPNVSTYYRLFKEKYGCSPNTFRSKP